MWGGLALTIILLYDWTNKGLIMAYYAGQCHSFQNLADILVEKCQAHGWVWQDEVLSKGDLFVKITVRNEAANTYHNVLQQGITLTGGTGRLGSNLINASSSVRLGRTAHNSRIPVLQYFPAYYHLFIFSDEVYLVMKFRVDEFYYLAFGKSPLTQANGLWLSANASYNRREINTSSVTEAVYIAPTYGGGSGTVTSSAFAPFWNRNNWSHNWSNATICHGMDGAMWSSGTSRAWCSFEPLINRLPTAHFSDSPLLPYNIYLERPENKLSLICQFENARFLRIDHHEPEQILTLGHERWMVFPFYKKDIGLRDALDGSGRLSGHTGTFGWAIRYEGA